MSRTQKITPVEITKAGNLQDKNRNVTVLDRQGNLCPKLIYNEIANPELIDIGRGCMRKPFLKELRY